MTDPQQHDGPSLLPCPFCSTALDTNRLGNNPRHPDNECFLSGQVVHVSRIGEWNARPTQPQAEGLVAGAPYAAFTMAVMQIERDVRLHDLTPEEINLIVGSVAAALRSPEPSEGWKPIETAPRDGTRVLLWIEPTQIAMAFAWRNERWMGDDFPLNMAWPTHWRPLPEPPRAAILSVEGVG